VAEATHIRLRYLQEMEYGNFRALPSKVQVKGFLRSYAGFLGLDVDTLIEAIEADSWTALAVLEENPEPEKGAADSPFGVSDSDSASNFASIGQTLQAQRELLGLSLQDVEQHTHLRIRYLKALESGDINGLPSPVQGRGMLKNYASFLSLDSDALLLLFADGLQARLSERPSQRISQRSRRPKSSANKKKGFITRDIVIGVFVVLFMATFLIWGISQVTALRSAEEPALTAPPIAEMLLPSPTATLIPTLTSTIPSLLDPENPVSEGAIPENGALQETQAVIVVSENIDAAVRVQIVVRQRSWMRITVDDKVEFDGRVIPGSAYAFAGEDVVEISTGNGAGLQVFYNDTDLGILGTYGEVIDFVITVTGVQTPTPTITFTPTQTPEVTSTPTPTP
jgi:cytoskeleton protein RodZ